MIRRAVAIPVIALLLLAAVFLLQVMSMKAAMQWVDHTDQVIGADLELLKLELDMESGLRGYLNTGSEEFLEPYNQANSSIDSKFDRLRQLISDNPSQQARLAGMRADFNQWRLDAQSTIELRRKSHARRSFEFALRHKHLMDSIRSSDDAFVAAEEKLRDQRVRSEQAQTRLIGISGVLIALGIGVLLAVFTRRRIKLIAARFQALLSLAIQRDAKLRESETGLRLALSANRAGTWTIDLPSGLRTLSPELRQLYGFDPSELDLTPEESQWEVIPEDHERLNAALQSGIQCGEFDVDFRYTRSGSRAIRWMQCRGQAIRDAHGQPIRLIGVSTDITERKQAELALYESQSQNEFLADVIRSSSQPLFIGHPDGSLGMVNRAFEELTGYSAEELSSICWADLIAPEFRNLEREKVAELHRTGVPVRYEKECIRKDGTRVPVELLLHLVTGSGEEPYYYGFLTDITERKRTESELQTRLQRFHLTLSSMYPAILLVSVGGFVEFANQAFCDYYGLADDPANLVGLSHSQLLARIRRWHADPEAAIARILAIVERAEPVAAEEIAMKNGRTFLRDYVPLKLGGKPYGRLWLHRDITERKKTELELAEARVQAERIATQLRTIFDNVQERLYVCDETGKLILANDFALRTFGQEEGAIVAPADEIEKIYDILDLNGNPLPKPEWPISRILRGERVRSAEVRIRNKVTGENLIVSCNGSVVRDRDGRILMSVFTTADITLRKEAERELQTTLQRFYSILSSMYSGVLLISPGGDVEFANQAFCDMYNLREAPADLAGVGQAQILAKIRNCYLDPEAAIARILAIVGRGEPVATEEIAMKSGRTFLRDYVPLKLGGKLYGRLWLHHDITERKQVQEALRESEQRFRSLFESNLDAVFLTGPGGSILQANEAACATFGMSEQEMCRVGHEGLWDHEDPRHAIALKERNRTGIVKHAELRYKRANDEVFTAEMDSVQLPGDSQRSFVLLRDITERKRAEAALRLSEMEALQRIQLRALAERSRQVREEERTRVARDLHDDIGQLLAAIKMDLTWLKRNLTAAAENEMQNRLARSLEMIADSVSSVRRICSGLRPGILDDLGLSAAIEWQANEFASRTGVDCEIILPSAELHVEGGKSTAIFRIFEECLANVTQHAEAKTVRISLSAEDGNLFLIVQDDGVGFQEPNVSNSMESLGLLGMKERAQACGGEAIFTSSPGNGTKVTVRVPHLLTNGKP